MIRRLLDVRLFYNGLPAPLSLKPKSLYLLELKIWYGSCCVRGGAQILVACTTLQNRETGMRLVRNILAVCVITLMSQVAVAISIPVNYTFDVQFTDGPLAATQATVAVTLSDVLGAGLEGFNPEGDLGGGTLLAFDFTFGGIAFSMTDDGDFGELPQVVLFDGGLHLIDFTSIGAVMCFLECETGPPNMVLFVSAEESISKGIILEQTWSRTDVSVPIPGTLVLFGVGLVGLGLQRSKRAASR